MKGLLLCATKPEWAQLKKYFDFKATQCPHKEHFKIYQESNGLFDLIQIGIGPTLAQHNTQHYLTHYKPQWMLHFGLSGGLDKSLKVGDCQWARHIKTQADTLEISQPSAYNQIELWAKAQGIPLSSVDHFTSSVVLKTPQEKQTHHLQYKVDTVDMESFYVAKLARAHNIPYYFLRSVFDTASEDLTLLAQAHTLNPEGDLQIAGTISSIIKKPKLILSLPQFQKQAAAANKNLSLLITKLISIIHDNKTI